MRKSSLPTALCALAALVVPSLARAQGQYQDQQGAIVEEIIARVNNDIITLSDYRAAESTLRPEAQQECQSCSAARINELVAQEKKTLLRDLIDNSLLVQRAKDLGINVDADVIKRLDMVRQQNHLPSMEALQKAVEASGMSWADYKQQIADSLLRQQVIQQEIGPTIKIGTDEVQKYYDAHKSEFVMPEEVDLSTIFLSTKGKTPQQVMLIKQKAENLVQRLKAGDDFAKLAQHFSEGPTAAEGGELGIFKRGDLTPQLEKLVFVMHKGDSTGVLPAPDGVQILHVNEHFTAGLQPVNKVESQIENDIYESKIRPAMRKYLTQLRKDSYVVVKAGYVDSGSAGGNSVIQEVPYGTEEGKVKKKKKKKVTSAYDDDGGF